MHVVSKVFESYVCNGVEITIAYILHTQLQFLFAVYCKYLLLAYTKDRANEKLLIYIMYPEMNRTGFNSYNSILIIVNKLVIKLYTAVIRQII